MHFVMHYLSKSPFSCSIISEISQFHTTIACILPSTYSAYYSVNISAGARWWDWWIFCNRDLTTSPRCNTHLKFLVLFVLSKQEKTCNTYPLFSVWTTVLQPDPVCVCVLMERRGGPKWIQNSRICALWCLHSFASLLGIGLLVLNVWNQLCNHFVAALYCGVVEFDHIIKTWNKSAGAGRLSI